MYDFMSYLHLHEGNRYLLSDDTLKRVIEVLERYIIYCRNLGNNNRTINGKITAISSFYKWAVRRDLIKHHPFRDKLFVHYNNLLFLLKKFDYFQSCHPNHLPNKPLLNGYAEKLKEKNYQLSILY